MNKRIERLRKAYEAAKQELDEAIDDVGSRETTTAFQQASSLFDDGWRLTGWGLRLTDTDNETVLMRAHPSDDPGKPDTAYPWPRHGYWADGTGRNTDQCWDIIFGQDALDKVQRIITQVQPQLRHARLKEASNRLEGKADHPLSEDTQAIVDVLYSLSTKAQRCILMAAYFLSTPEGSATLRKGGLCD